LPSDESVQR